MDEPIKIPYAEISKEGRVICPVCGKPVDVPKDAWLAPGIGNCMPDATGHTFAISENGALQANEILAKSNEGEWRKPINKNYGGIPKGAKPLESDDGSGVLIL